MKTKKFTSKLIASLMVSTTILQLSAPISMVHANDENRISYAEEEDCFADTKKIKSDTEKTSGSVSTADDAWLTEGTEQYAVAKRIFEVFTQEYGTSGAFAAGVLANVKGESNFIPDVMEGGVRAGMNNPTGKSFNSAFPGQEGGGGLFQFTGYSKFSKSKWWQGRPGSEGWAIENQVDAVWGLEFGNRAVELYFSRTGKNAFKNVEELISSEDPALASEYFQMAYERPQHFHPERAEWAKKANAVFNKDNIKADPSKFKFDGGSSSAVSVKVQSKKAKESECGEEETEITGGAWGKDGTGSWEGARHAYFKKDDLPAELRKYALNPESVGMKYGAPYSNSQSAPDSNGWISCYPAAPGQCTELAVSLAYNIWSKGGKGMYYGSPNGNLVVGHLVNTFGGESSRTPKSGAIFSFGAGANHVGMVSHVFENGDILIIEQNVEGYSGFTGGGANTWSYQYVPVSVQKSQDYTFYYPGDNGFTVNPDAKTLE